MDEVKKEVTEALAVLSAIYVNGDAVDIVAAVRSKLKRAISLMEKGDDNG